MPAKRGDSKKGRSALDDWVEELQERISAEERRTFSERVLAEASRPRNLGRLGRPDGTASFRGPCGDTMELDLRISGGRISDIRFRTDGCGASVATGSMLTGLVKGRTVRAARALTEERLLEALGGLPEENRHCARLAVTTLRMALDGRRRRGPAAGRVAGRVAERAARRAAGRAAGRRGGKRK